MTRAGIAVSSIGWAVGYGLAMEVGRVLTLPGESLAIIWPACGVAALWLLGRRGPCLAIDLTLLAGVSMLVNTTTGVSLPVASWFVLVGVAQGLVGARLLERLCPELWGCGGTATFDSVGRLYRLLLAAVVSSLAAALLTAAGLWWFVAEPTPMGMAIYLSRNVCGFLVVVALVHLLAHAWRFRGAQAPVLPPERVAEALLLGAVTVVVFGVAFLQSSLPLAFVPAAATIWAGLRFTPVVVAVHVALVGAFALGATLAGLGPFAVVGDLPVRGLLVQLLIVILVLKGLSLAAVRSQQASLLAAVAESGRQASAQAALLSTIMDTIHPGLVVLDVAGRPTRVNEAATVLLGRRPVSAAGVYAEPGRSQGPAEAWTAVWTHLAEREAPAPFDLRLEGPRGATVLEVRPALMTEGGERTGTVVLLSDVTEERTAREGLTGFAGTVAHDLRGPLTGVKGWSHALADELEADDADLGLASTMVRRVVTAASRMDDLIGDLLAHAVSRDSALHPSTVALDRITLEVAETLTAEGQVVVHDLVEVLADESLVRHLVTNLVSNALKYVAPGTTPRLDLRARTIGDMVEVRVSDNGIGIPVDQRERVFEQFHRVHADLPGTGLGLAICRTIVERHGGTIRAEDGEDGGSCIVFTLPAPARAVVQPAPPTEVVPRPGVGGAPLAPRASTDSSAPAIA